MPGHNGGFNPYRDRNGEFVEPGGAGAPGRSRVGGPSKWVAIPKAAGPRAGSVSGSSAKPATSQAAAPATGEKAKAARLNPELQKFLNRFSMVPYHGAGALPNAHSPSAGTTLDPTRITKNADGSISVRPGAQLDYKGRPSLDVSYLQKMHQAAQSGNKLGHNNVHTELTGDTLTVHPGQRGAASLPKPVGNAGGTLAQALKSRYTDPTYGAGQGPRASDVEAAAAKRKK